MLNLFKVPKLSSSMTKAIRTSEGIMAWVVTIGTGVLSYVEGLEFIPHKEAVIIIAANTAFHTSSRTLLKIFALQKEVGIPVPTESELPPVIVNEATTSFEAPSRPESSISPDAPQIVPLTSPTVVPPVPA